MDSGASITKWQLKQKSKEKTSRFHALPNFGILNTGSILYV